MKMKIAKKFFSATLAMAATSALCLATAVTGFAAVLPADNHDGHDHSQEADPALQQVVSDSEGFGSGSVDFTHGHFDLAPRFVDGTLKFVGRDDSGDKPVWRKLNDVVFVLGAKSVQTVPEGPDYAFTGAAGKQVYTVPQTEIQDVPWLGWSTQSPEYVKRVKSPTVISFEGHQGPGRFTAFVQAGNFGKPQLLWDSAKKETQKINVDPNTHAHLNWVFTDPGTHLIRIGITAKVDNKDVSDTVVLRFAVGQDPKIDAARQAKWPNDTAEKAKPEAAAAATAPAQPERSRPWLPLAIGGGMVAAGIVLAVVAVAITRRDRRRRAAALAESERNTSDA